MKIGIFGGSFSPPHLGHVRGARLFKAAAGLSRLIIMPAGIPPHKQLNTGAGAKERLEMCRLAFGEIGEVSDFEIKKEGASYTVETLRYFKALYPRDELFWFMGEDMLLCFDLWREPQEIASLATICCMRRGEVEKEIFNTALRDFSDKYKREPMYFEDEPFVVSSSEIRKMIKEKEDVSHLLSDEVYGYIKENNLYNE